MKCIRGQWFEKVIEYFQDNPLTCVNGFKRAGIHEALDVFSDDIELPENEVDCKDSDVQEESFDENEESSDENEESSDEDEESSDEDEEVLMKMALCTRRKVMIKMNYYKTALVHL